MYKLMEFFDALIVFIIILDIIDFIISRVMREYNQVVCVLIFRVICGSIGLLIFKLKFPRIVTSDIFWILIVLNIIELLSLIRCYFQNEKRELEKKQTITVNKISPKKELAMYERMFQKGVISKSIYEKKRNAILETQRTYLESLEKSLHQNEK